MLELKKMNERFPEWVNGGGIFSKIFIHQTYYRPEWLNTPEHAKKLDILYHGKHSFDKVESSLSHTLFDVFENDAFLYISDSIVEQFSLNWEKLYTTLHFDYNPIWNVDGTEERETIYTTDDVTTRKIEEDKNETRNINVETNVVKDETNNSVFAFDSSTPSPSSKTEHAGEQNETTGDTLIATNENNENINDKKSQTTKETLKRSGNIGVTMTQQLIEAERNMWLWNFYEQIFKDIDGVLTSAFWD